MEHDQTQDQAQHETDRTEQLADDSAELVEELLIEEISIDGMCGVY